MAETRITTEIERAQAIVVSRSFLLDEPKGLPTSNRWLLVQELLNRRSRDSNPRQLFHSPGNGLRRKSAALVSEYPVEHARQVPRATPVGLLVKALTLIAS